MIRVAHITSVHPVFDVRIFEKECRSLAREGYDVNLVAPHSDDASRDGVRIWAIERRTRRLHRMTSTAYAAFRRAADLKADLYHVHDPELLPWALLLQKSKRVPVIYDSHEYVMDDVGTKDWLLPAIARPLSRLVDALEKSVARRIDGVITVNPHMADMFRPFNDNVGVVANFPHREMAAFRSATAPAPFSAIYTGPLDRDRGLPTVVSAMTLVRHSFPTAFCAVLGEVDFGNNSSLSASALERAGVRVLPRVPHGEVSGVLASHSVGWLPWTNAPAYVHGTPTKLLEYMALGLPVVASNLPFVAQIVESSNCGVLVDSADARMHADALLSLWSDPDRARALGNNGRQAVLTRFNWESQVPALTHVYERALDGPTAQP